jgi:hypothetical protein
VPDVRAGFDTARPNRACDDGIEGPLTETQTDASRRTRLGARNGLQLAAHLDLLHILLLDRLDQLHSLLNLGVRVQSGSAMDKDKISP